jgi:hypothetical protein
MLTLMKDYRPRMRAIGRRLGSEEIWDAFVDELDRAGQAGSAAAVLTPTTLHVDSPAGKPFGSLTRLEIDNLVAIGKAAGRRGEVVKEIWTVTRKPPRRARSRGNETVRPASSSV